MSVGGLLNPETRFKLEKLAKNNKCRLYAPSGAIVGLDGIKAASLGKIQRVTLVTRKPPRSLGINTEKETILYQGEASEAVQKFPLNINVAATVSMAVGQEIEVKIIADPDVDRNMHELEVVGDFGEFQTITSNIRCSMNPKTSVLAAYSAIKLLNSLNENFLVGT